MKSSSIQDVAQLAHVSISTVSRSFTRPDLVSKATRDKVMKAADELNFSISRSAAALKTGRALRIAVLVSGRLNLWFSSSIIEGLNEVFHDEGYDISIYQMSSTEERSEFFNMLPVRRNVDAVIVISFDIASNEIEQLRSIDVPIIGINSSLPEERGFNAAVRIDDKQGSELAARHLMMLGHRDIVYIRSDREVTLHFSVQGRYESFMACCPPAASPPALLLWATLFWPNPVRSSDSPGPVSFSRPSARPCRRAFSGRSFRWSTALWTRWSPGRICGTP